MQTYWDLNDTQRAELSDEAFANYERVELAENGVLNAPPERTVDSAPNAAPEPNMVVTTVTLAGATIAFRDASAALEFIEQEPLLIDNRYPGQQWSFSFPVALGGARVVGDSKVFPADEWREIQEKARVASLFAIASKDDDAAIEAYWERRNAALSVIREDRQRCGGIQRKTAEVARVFADYLEITDGNERVAHKLLRKAFSSEEIEAWTPVALEPPREGEVLAP